MRTMQIPRYVNVGLQKHWKYFDGMPNLYIRSNEFLLRIDQRRNSCSKINLSVLFHSKSQVAKFVMKFIRNEQNSNKNSEVISKPVFINMYRINNNKIILTLPFFILRGKSLLPKYWRLPKQFKVICNA